MTSLSRRRFFGLLGGAAAVHFLPPIGGWKSDVITSPYEVIPGECLFLLGHSDGKLWWSKDKPESNAGAITIEMLQDAFAATLMLRPSYSRLEYRNLWTS